MPISRQRSIDSPRGKSTASATASTTCGATCSGVTKLMLWQPIACSSSIQRAISAGGEPGSARALTAWLMS